jgi:intracellular septation protein A
LQTSVHKQIELQLAIRLATLAGLLVLTARILLLLSWLLATALLLARLLSGILVLLAGILVLIGHRDLLF